MEASLFIDGVALLLVDRVARLALGGRALLLVIRPALLLALGLEEALPSVGRGPDQLAVLGRRGEGVRDASGHLGQKANDNHLQNNDMKVLPNIAK